MSELQILEIQIKRELSKLKNLLSEAEEIKNKKASNWNMRIGGSILHDFYTGIEGIFEAIASTIDKRCWRRSKRAEYGGGGSGPA